MPPEAKEFIQQIKLDHELHTCPDCGYTDGFHVSFKKVKSSKKWHVVLICPQCHARYQTEWKASLDNEVLKLNGRT
jgi:transcription elongation factor Elf1